MEKEGRHLKQRKVICWGRKLEKNQHQLQLRMGEAVWKAATHMGQGHRSAGSPKAQGALQDGFSN